MKSQAMDKIVRRCFFGAGLAVFVLAGMLLNVQGAEPTFSEEATRRFREAVPENSSGVAVLVAKEGQIVFQGGFGLADIENKVPITVDTKFRIGSVTKQFAAVAILRLAEQGKLSLEDKLDKFFPDFPRGSDVTIKQLLNHTSGIHSYTDKKDFLGKVKEPVEPSKLIAYFQNDLPDFLPGKGFHYNNSAYFLLGEIVAKVSGESFADHLRSTLFEPLGMKNTGIFVNAKAPDGMAKGYSYLQEKLEPALDWDMSWAGGAGALYSTVGDLFLWNEALYGGKVLNEASLREAMTPNVLPADVDGMIYGYGLVISEVKRMPAVGHSGGLHGWTCDLLRLPEQKCTVVALTNASPPAPKIVAGAITRTVAEKLLSDEIAKLPPIAEDKTVDPKTFSDFVGRYDYKSGIMTVTVEGDELFAQITGQPKNRIFPRSKDAFFWKVSDADVLFVRDAKGSVKAARHTQGGSVFTASKFPENSVQLTAEQIEPFLGEYQYGPQAIMTVTRIDNQLFAQLTGQPKFPIFATSENEFEWSVVKAKVQFVRDDASKVTKAIHTQNGSSFDAPKVK